MADSESRKAVDALLSAALDQPTEERQAFLDRRAPEGPVRDAVDRMLRSIEEDTLEMSGDPFVGAYHSIATELADHPAEPGDSIGPFRVVEEIGRGGMAAVYLAERIDGQIEQRVALKLSQKVTGSVRLQRFQQERQILASLQHPGIARLLDAGLTPDGRPYFAMELVEGEPIDAHCDRLRLSVAERLRLFVQVGKAVEAAHRALIVHRDIKPANVMVGKDGRVKLLDFGIAKLLDDPLTPGLTATAAVVMTPDYASPEQYRGEPVTTATDIYQLGLLLYELLAGMPPYRVSTLSPIDAMRAVCEQQPVRPSTQLRQSSQSRQETVQLADLRQTTVDGVIRQLKGDLDTIVLKALRKEPERRYASAADLVDDVQRYLDGRPVSARGDSRLYRARKFVGRNRLAVALGTAALLAMAGQLVFYTQSLQEERNEAQRQASRAEAARAVAEQARGESEEVVTFLEGLFAGSDAGVKNADQVSARELLDQGTARLRDQLEDRPLTRARLLSTVARVSRHIGLFEEAEEAAEEAVEILREQGHGEGLQAAQSFHELAAVYRARGKLERAAEHYRAADELYQTLGMTQAEAADLKMSLALLEVDLGHLEKAERLYDQVGDAMDALPKEEQLSYLNNYALLLAEMGKYRQAEGIHRQALEMRIELLGPDHIDVSSSYNNLANVAENLGRQEEARDLQVRALEIKEKVLGPDNPGVAGALSNLSTLERDLGNYDQARAHVRRAIDIMTEHLGPNSPRLANAYTNLASLELAEERYAEAEDGFRRALEIRRASLGELHKDVGAAYLNMGEVFRESDRFERAEGAYEKALDVLGRTVGEGHPYYGYGLACMGKLYAKPRPAEAIGFLERADTVLAPVLGENHEDIQEIRALKAEAQGRLDG